MPKHEPTYRCALCGPASLHGDRSEHDCECRASRAGFKKNDCDLFLSCLRCGAKMSLECLEALSDKVDEFNYPLHDPEGVWETLRARPWASGPQPDSPLKAWSDSSRALHPCILCEQGELPTAEPNPELDEIKKLGADHDPAVPLAVAVTPVFADGRRTTEMGRLLNVVHLYPLVTPHDSESLFKHGTGSLEETGSVPQPKPRPRYPRCTPPLTSPFPLTPFQHPSHRSLDVGPAIRVA